MVTKQKSEKNNINYKKLFFELMLMLTIIFGVVISLLYPVLKEHGAFDKKDPYETVRKIVDEAKAYDYSKGRDLDFEKRLDTEFLKADNMPAKRFYYGIASGVYYCNLGYYTSANSIFNELYNLLPDGEASTRNDLEVEDAICDRKINEYNNQQENK